MMSIDIAEHKPNTEIAKKYIISIGGLVVNQDLEGLFTIKKGDIKKIGPNDDIDESELDEEERKYKIIKSQELKDTSYLIEKYKLSNMDIAHMHGIGFAKGKRRADRGELRAETGYREIYEELGLQKHQIHKICMLGQINKNKQFFYKTIILDLYIALTGAITYTPKHNIQHEVIALDLYTALKYMRSSEEKEFLSKNIEYIRKQIEIYKQAKTQTQTEEVLEMQESK